MSNKINEKSNCFISYCHADVNAEEIRFFAEILKNNIQKISNLLYDMDYEPGQKISSFMKLLDRVDLVIMICTPKYREKAEKGKEEGGGVGFEYNLIKTRYEKVLQEKKDAQNEHLSERSLNPFEVLPLVFRGDYASSIPLEFQDNKAIDMTYFRLTTKKQVARDSIKTLPKEIILRFERDVSNILGVLKTNHTLKQKSYEAALEEVESQLRLNSLFKDTKADFGHVRNDFGNSPLGAFEFDDALFVRTNVYQQVETQSAYLLVGRKGSGKSAITQVLPIRSRRFGNSYFDVIDIYANRDINLNVLYSFLNKGFISDSEHVFERLKCFKYGWALFFRICIMDTIVNSVKELDASDHNHQRIRRINEFLLSLNKKQGEKSDDKSSYFAHAFSAIQRFMNHCVSKARNEEQFFLSDILAQFNLSNFIDFAIGAKNASELNDYLEYLPKKFLITFDGFDTEIEKFREAGQFFEQDSREEKIKFEIDWLHSLLLMVNDMKQLGPGKDVLNDRLDFCITIPSHRYLEIVNNDIDSYRFQHRRKNLIWTGVELLIFLRKRLEILSDLKTTQKLPWPSYKEILKTKFPYIPQTIEFDFNNKHIKIDLFLYVLRHTFWRPRDILLYFSHIITLCKESHHREYIISSEAIRSCIANLTFEIIKDDFKNEYKGTLRNIEQVIESFNRAKQVLPFSAVAELLYHVDFEFAVSRGEKQQDILEKIKFLFQIGFLGVKADKEMIERFNLTSPHVFIFSEGSKPLKKVSKEKIKTYEFIIHPIFSEYLELNTKENEFISEYTEQYIMDLEGYMRASNEDFECN
ncbi:MAG TPA: hypothetical protein VK772_18205 [Puia sp.]|jgi:hypothetical protein|nr:hypothetical protein [Puia sp.]